MTDRGYILDKPMQTHPMKPKYGFRKGGWLSYEISKALVNQYAPHITSKRKYRRWIEEMNVKFVPRYPERVYEGFSWNDYLNNNNKTPIEKVLDFRNKGIKYRPMWESVKFVQKYCRENGITTKDQWWAHYPDAEDIPNDIPRYPHATYKSEFSEKCGYKVWIGKKASAVLDVEANIDAIISLVHVSGETPNVVALKAWTGGASDLKENWSKQSDYDKIYGQWKYERELMPDTKRILSELGSERDGKWIISNMNELMWQLNSLLMIIR